MTNQPASVVDGVLQCTSSGGRTDYFSLVSQVSPHGSATLEDLVMHDPDDPQQWVLVVVYQEDNRYQVFRRRFLEQGPVREQ
jgi:hypothetical protein